MVSTVSVPEANRLVENREIKHYTEINYQINTDSLFPGTVAIWIDREPPPNWIDLPRKEIGAVYTAEVRRKSFGQIALTDWADGRHTVYVDVDHPEDETWFGYIVIDDDTLAGIVRQADILFNQHLKIDVVTRGGVVISAVGMREVAKQPSALPIPDVLTTAVDVADQVRDAVTGFFGSLIPQTQAQPPETIEPMPTAPQMEETMPPVRPVAPPPSRPPTVPPQPPSPPAPMPEPESTGSRIINPDSLDYKIRAWLEKYQTATIILAGSGAGLATVIYWMRNRGGSGI